jgi:hypothetical protein
VNKAGELTLDLYTRRTDDSSRILRALDDEDPGRCARARLMPFSCLSMP